MTEETEARAEQPEKASAGDFFVVRSMRAYWYVSRAMVMHIEREMARWPRRTWVTFVDLSGSRVRQRAAAIEWIAECSAEQRAADRAFRRALDDESSAAPWEDD